MPSAHFRNRYQYDFDLESGKGFRQLAVRSPVHKARGALYNQVAPAVGIAAPLVLNEAYSYLQNYWKAVGPAKETWKELKEYFEEGRELVTPRAKQIAIKSTLSLKRSRANPSKDIPKEAKKKIKKASNTPAEKQAKYVQFSLGVDDKEILSRHAKTFDKAYRKRRTSRKRSKFQKLSTLKRNYGIQAALI